jgi:uncharacterized membrane protein YdjX (TVP38/TMEM64 family)
VQPKRYSVDGRQNYRVSQQAEVLTGIEQNSFLYIILSILHPFVPNAFAVVKCVY